MGDRGDRGEKERSCLVLSPRRLGLRVPASVLPRVVASPALRVVSFLWQHAAQVRHLNGLHLPRGEVFGSPPFAVLDYNIPTRIEVFIRHFLTVTPIALLAIVGLFTYGHTRAQQQANMTVSGGTLSQSEIERIIHALSQHETEFRHALNSYGFRRDVVVQSIGLGGQIMGEYHRTSTFTFDNSGNRYEKIVFFPMPTLTDMSITPEDLEDLGGVNPFALEPSQINQYNFTYVGREHIDELDLYVFDVAPKVMPDPRRSHQRLFQGRIWVDQRDLQIVKTRGKGVPETKTNKFPTVETYREQIDGRYWFPTYSYADDQLIFGNGSVLHVRMRVRYTDFTPGVGRATITEVEGPEPDASPTPTPSPTPQPTPQVGVGSAHDIVSGGVLNERALELPKPVYPPAAKRAHVTGTVKVKVLVDEHGKVTSAEVIEGPDELQQAAIDAAYKARFSPTIIDGHPVKVSGELDYDFTGQ